MGEISSQEPLLLKEKDDFDHVKKIPFWVSSTKLILKVVMWVIFIAWATFLFLLPSKFMNDFQGKCVRATNGTIFGTTGSIFLIFSFPILLIAFLAIIRLVLTGEGEPQVKKAAKGPSFRLWTFPVLVDGPFGVVTAAEMIGVIIFSVYIIWSVVMYTIRNIESLSQFHVEETNKSTGGLLVYAEANVESGKQILEKNHSESEKKRVVVLGTGWAGTSFLKDLDVSSYDVQVVSPRNYFAFTPLLPSVTCGTVEARSIVEPVRNIIKKRSGEIRFCEAECLKIDPENRKVFCRSGINDNLVGEKDFSLQYDYLVIAVGAQVNTFNTPGVMEHCHFLKEVEDAQRIRRTVIDCFEQAVVPGLTEEEQRMNLHFVIVGGGPTGVEFAAELHDFVHEDLVKIYPSVKDLVKITLIQSGDHILNTFDERISSFAEQKFQRDGIEVLTGCRVTSVSDHFINMNVKSTGELVAVPYGMVVWSTGVGTRPFVKDFMEQIGQGKRRVLTTDEWLRVKGCSDVYALGDCATVDQRKVMEDISAIFTAADKDGSGTLTIEEFRDVLEDITIRYPQVALYMKNKHLLEVTDLFKDSEGNDREEVDIEGFKLALSLVDSQMKSLPATAQVAAQQGTYLARCFNRWEQCQINPEGPRRFKSSGRHEFMPFGYRHLGQFAPLGGEQAAAELPGDWVTMGHSTQWLWYSVYASKQVSWRTRYLVVGDWVRRFIFGRDSSRI